MMLMSIVALATEPATIALCGSIGGGLLLKGTEVALSKRKPVPVPVDAEEARIEGLAQAILTDDSFGGCTLEFQRAFEQKFIDAGIPTTLSKCYDERCETCHPKNSAWSEAPEIGTVNRRRTASCVVCSMDVATYSSNKASVTCRPCSRESAKIHLDRKKSLSDEKKRAKEAYEKSKSGKQRTVVVNNRVVPIPNNVPKWATATFVYDPSFMRDDIVWSWTLDGDPNGKPMAFRQHVDAVWFNSLPKASKPKNMFDVLHEEHKRYKQEIKAQEYKIDEFKKEMNYLNEQMCKMESIPRNKYSKGTKSTGPL